MERISFFLAEYEAGITTAVWGVVLLLLLTTLHKIRRIGRQVRKIAETEERIQSGMDNVNQTISVVLRGEAVPDSRADLKNAENAGSSENAGNTENAGNAENAGILENAGTSENAGNTENAGNAENVQRTGRGRMEAPEALLDEVLGEVFP